MLGRIRDITQGVPINEVYASIQGEATWTGTPAWFVRTQGCPVGCPWCDTKYTWEIDLKKAVSPTTLDAKGGNDETFGLMEPDVLLGILHQRRGIKHVVLTGGEPAMWDLVPITRMLLSNGYRVQLETSGTFPIVAAPGIWITCSPKIGMPGGRIVLAEVLAAADEIKYPIGKSSDMDKLLDQVMPYVRASTPVWLQPISQSKRATELCIYEASRRGMRISVQVHKYLDLA